MPTGQKNLCRSRKQHIAQRLSTSIPNEPSVCATRDKVVVVEKLGSIAMGHATPGTIGGRTGLTTP